MNTGRHNMMYLHAGVLFVALSTILLQPVSSMMNGTMAHSHNNTMNHTMSGNHTMGGHGNHTMGGHGNHTMGGHGNHTMGGHGNHTNHGNNGTGRNHHGNTGNTGHTGHTNTGHTGHNTGHGTYFITTEHLTLFFEGWTSDSKKDFTIMCVVLGLIGILYEGLKLCRQYLTKAQMAASAGTNQAYSTKNYGDHSYKKSSTSKKICLHLFQTVLHTIQIFIGYLLMLGFMTFNTYICVSIMAGFAVGFLCFGWVLPAYLLTEDPDACCS